MNKKLKYAFKIIDEYFNSLSMTGKSDVDLAEVALFLEDEFDISITDNEICKENLGSKKAVNHYITKKYL